MNKSFLVIALILGSLNAFCGAKLVEKISKDAKNDKLVIPYEKYLLDNGLTVIIHEDHSDPIVHLDVTYHVGSAREVLRKSGFAHFFEHMMFQGSKNVGDEQHFKIVSGAGGTMNGTTNRDRTNYFETVPKNYLETVLWLEADRMGFLLDSVTQKKFEVQRSTVKNEKGQRYENMPYGLAAEYGARNFYPFGHPYSWLTIGYIEDLNRVSVEDLKTFFKRWYGPNNAVLTVGGDLDTKQTLSLIEKYFESMNPGPKVEKMPIPSFTLDKNRYVSYEDKVRFPRLEVRFVGSANYTKDEAALDVLAEILGQGKSSIMYQKFVKTRKAYQASASHPSSELSGEFSFDIMLLPDTKLSEAEAMVKETIADFEKRGVTDNDLKKVIAGIESNKINGLETVSGKVSQLAAYQTFAGNPNMIQADIDKYSKVSKEDVMRVFNKYVKGQNALYLSIVPKGKSNLIASPDNYSSGSDTSKIKIQETENVTFIPAKDNFDRSKQPIAGASPQVSIPESYNFTFPNKIKGIGTANYEIPVVSTTLVFKAGNYKQPKGKEGVGALLTRLLRESTKLRKSEDVSEELDLLGSSIGIIIDDENLSVFCNSLLKNEKRTQEIVQEIMLSPAFNEEEFQRVKKNYLEAIANSKTQATTIAGTAYSRLLYGTDNPLGRGGSGTEKTIGSITLQDVVDFYNKNIRPENMTIAVSGAISNSDIQKVFNGFSSWKNLTLDDDKITIDGINGIPSPITSKPDYKTKIYLVNKEKAPQSEIRIGYEFIPRDLTGDFFKANLMNYILGGAFNSRINLNLRENKGYTYGARSGFASSGKLNGYYSAAAGVRADATAPSVKEFMYEIEKFKTSGITEDELTYTKKSILEKEALSYESNGQKIGYLNRIIVNGAKLDYPLQQGKLVQSMKVEDINLLAKKYLPTDKFIILVVGDKSYKEALEKLGYEVVEYNEELF